MSHSTFYIADLHLGHVNMAKKRGFKSVEEHDEFIINNWNKVVNKRDTVYILGDLTMENKKHFSKLNKLKGNKYCVLGNHEKRGHIPELLNYLTGVASVMRKTFRLHKKRAFLTHIPVHPREFRKGRIDYNIHGHIHEYTVKKWFGLVRDKRYINVSCEQIGYTPRTIEELLDGNR